MRLTDGNILESFESKYEPEPNTGCWLWLAGASGRNGYGQFWDGYALVAAHRMSYELYVGPIPEELWCLHKCDVRLCVNPKHLYIGDSEDNNRDTRERGRFRNGNMGKTHCKHGHPFSQENTLITPGRRRCRICRDRSNSRYRGKCKHVDGLTGT